MTYRYKQLKVKIGKIGRFWFSFFIKPIEVQLVFELLNLRLKFQEISFSMK